MRPSSRAPTGPRARRPVFWARAGRPVHRRGVRPGRAGPAEDPAFVTGDGFAIELVGGAYGAYTRGGYIEGGNIQVRGNSG